MLVKVCGMTDPSNLIAIAELSPDLLGFIFYRRSPRYVGDKPGKELFTSVPAGIKKAGVFFNEDTEKILELSKYAGLDMIQLHGNESPEYCMRLKSTGLKIIKVFKIDVSLNICELRAYSASCDYFLFDTKSGQKGGSGKKFDWCLLAEYSLDKPFFLSGGIGPDDGREIKALRNSGLSGVDINSRFEISPGIKDVSDVKRFIDEIKSNHK